MGDTRSAWGKLAHGVLFIVALVALSASVASVASAAVTGVTRVSLLASGTEIAGRNTMSSISGDGRYVAFESDATMAISALAYANGPSIYLRDRTDGTLTLVTPGVGWRADGPSHAPVVSADGRYVIFTSRASNLITSTDTITNAGVYRWSVAAPHAIERVDVVGPEPVAWSTGLVDSPAGDWWYTSVSDDGRFVAFVAPEAPGSSRVQVFVRDMDRSDPGAIVKVSVDSAGVQATTPARHPSISADGSRVAFATTSGLDSADQNSRVDVYVRDLVLGTTIWASVPEASAFLLPTGASDWPSLSADGNAVAFVSSASNLVTTTLTTDIATGLVPNNVYVRSLLNATTELVSLGNVGSASGSCWRPALSRDGRYVAFQSSAANLKVVGAQYPYYSVFVRDRLAVPGVLSAVASQSVQPDDSSSSLGFTSDARYLVFSSDASNIVSGDGNGTRDVFLLEYKYKAIPTLYRPRVSSYVRRNRYFYVAGTVSKHSDDRGAVVIKLYRRLKVGTKYFKSYTVYTAVNGTSYKKKLKLPYTGKWCVRTYHAECDFFKSSYSAYRYFTVYR